MIRFLLILLVTAQPALAQDQIDYVDLGARLLKDGYTERARNVLDKADVTLKGFDFARYYTLKGILLHKLSYPDLSNIFFEAAAERGQLNPSIKLYMAKNYWLLHEYQAVIDALDEAGVVAKESEALMVIKAESYKLLGEVEKSWAVLDEGLQLFPDSSTFYRQKFYYLLELGYYQRATEYAHKFLSAENYSARDYLAVAFAMRESRQYDAAAALLEEGSLNHPGDDKLIELLGQVYIDQDKFIPAALVYDWASIEHPRFAHKAATLYLKAAQPVRSLQLNRRIINQADKFRQRLGIDIHLDDYEALVAKIPALKRYDLMREDDIAYAVGYAHFKNGDYGSATTYLQKIQDSDLFSKAATIFERIEKCQDDPLECY